MIWKKISVFFVFLIVAYEQTSALANDNEKNSSVSNKTSTKTMKLVSKTTLEAAKKITVNEKNLFACVKGFSKQMCLGDSNGNNRSVDEVNLIFFLTR